MMIDKKDNDKKKKTLQNQRVAMKPTKNTNDI